MDVVPCKLTVFYIFTPFSTREDTAFSYSLNLHANSLSLFPGENTLEAQLVRVLMKSIVACGGRFDAAHFCSAYVKFMRTPGSHNDTYASTAHRQVRTRVLYLFLLSFLTSRHAVIRLSLCACSSSKTSRRAFHQ